MPNAQRRSCRLDLLDQAALSHIVRCGKASVMSDHSGRLIRHTILYLPAQFFPPLVQFATMIAWTHLLRPAEFGIVAFVLAAQEFTVLVGIT
jgi:hypothetical protein